MKKISKRGRIPKMITAEEFDAMVRPEDMLGPK